MEEKSIEIEAIGIIRTSHKEISGMPIQPNAAEGYSGCIELNPNLVEGLTDLEGFSHLTLLYHFHNINGYELMVKPFMDNQKHGIFATRSPKRPNAIGISTVKLVKVEGNRIYIDNVDMLDGTPLIDIKPFFEGFDNRTNTRKGWLEKRIDTSITKLRSDERFN